MGELLSGRKNVLGVLCLFITGGIVLAGLWPFNFWPENKVRWLQDRSGLQFYGQGIVYSPNPFFQPADIPMTSMTIETWVQPDKETFSYLPQLLTIWNRRTSEYLSIGQWQSHLVIQSRMLNLKKKRVLQKVGVENALQEKQRRFLTITSNETGTNIYIDGRLEENSRNYFIIPSMDKITSSNFLILGNSSTGQQHWMGSLLGLAIYNQSLTGEQISQHFQKWQEGEKSSLLTEKGLIALYSFDERSGEHIHDLLNRHHLLMPRHFQALQKRILVPPWKDFRFNRSYLTDILTNILGFIPFGFLLPAYLRMRKPQSNFRLFLTTPVIAGCISLSIELIQIYLPTRSSQLMDVITNILGAAMGVALFFKTRKA